MIDWDFSYHPYLLLKNSVKHLCEKTGRRLEKTGQKRSAKGKKIPARKDQTVFEANQFESVMSVLDCWIPSFC